MDITKKVVFLTAWLSFLFAEIWGLIWEVDFFVALERSLWFAFIMAGLGWLTGMLLEFTLKEINYFAEEEEMEKSTISKVDYTLPEDMPLTDFEAVDPIASGGSGEITAENFEEEIKKMADENPRKLADTVKTELDGGRR